MPEHLKNINEVNFTKREIDILSAMVSGRGIKNISSLLSISTRTVEAHMYNIMRKLECNSREGIIDFIEKSNYYSEIKKHYLNILKIKTNHEQSIKIETQLSGTHDDEVIQKFYNKNIKHIKIRNFILLSGFFILLSGIIVVIFLSRSTHNIIQQNQIWDGKKYNKTALLQEKWGKNFFLSNHKLLGNEKILDIGSGDGKITFNIARFLTV
jgi:DNA-binding CsgD family transcriptional regulator